MAKETKPLDIVVLIAALVNEMDGRTMNQGQLAEHLELQPSQVYYALKNCARADLWNLKRKLVHRLQLLEFLEHGVRYAFPAAVGEKVQGMPTRNATGLNGGPVFVWSCDVEGAKVGREVPPLHKIVPRVAVRDLAFRELMSLVDSVRMGRARERTEAAALMRLALAQ